MCSKFSLVAFVAVLIAIFFTGCGPIYDTQYTFDPPEGGSGRACVAQCETSKFQCEQLEEMKADRCRDRAEREAEQCRNRVYWKEGREPKWYECGTDSCSTDAEKCESRYRSCYQTCGGRVRSETRCVANCDQVPRQR